MTEHVRPPWAVGGGAVSDMSAGASSSEKGQASCSHGNPPNPPTPEPDVTVLITPFDAAFDKHFETNSARIDQALQEGRCEDPAHDSMLAPFPSLRSRAEGWGLKVRLLLKFWDYIEEDFVGYTSMHGLIPSDMNVHVCLVTPCMWCHGSAVPRPFEQLQESRNSTRPSLVGGTLLPMRPNMHMVVQRYVRPWTEGRGAGMSLLLNAGHMARKLQMKWEEFCLATIFISHTWGELFKDFVTTIRRRFEADTVVWICSLGIYQHGDIAGGLSDIESCPFVVAMKHSNRVLAISDHQASMLDRCWCVLEAHFSKKLGTAYEICLPRDDDLALWQQLRDKIELVDVEQCGASRESDKIAILDLARVSEGGIPALNTRIREVSRDAAAKAELQCLLAYGDVQGLDRFTSEMLLDWRSSSGKTTAHVAAQYGHVALLVAILAKTEHDHLEVSDQYGRTPLSAAVEENSFASTLALIGCRANVNAQASDGLRPIHFATANGHKGILKIILHERGEVDAQSNWNGRQGFRPLVIASFSGHVECCEILLQARASVMARVSNGSHALIYAAQEGQTDVCALLLRWGCEVDAVVANEHARTALMITVKNGHVSTAACLLQSKASVTREDAHGDSSYKFCEESSARFPDQSRQIRQFLDAQRESASPGLQRVGRTRALVRWLSTRCGTRLQPAAGHG